MSVGVYFNPCIINARSFNPSEGMEKMLPHGITVDSLNDATAAIDHLLENDEERQRSAHLGCRHVMNNHTILIEWVICWKKSGLTQHNHHKIHWLVWSLVQIDQI